MLLSDEFIKNYETKPLPFGGNGLGQFVFLRTYARWINELGRREKWHETVKRVVEFSMSLYTGHKSKSELIKYAEELYDYVFNLKVFPAGRSMWIGGTKASEKFGSANFNCFERNTRFLTKSGIKSFNDFNDGDVVEILTKNGSWKKAEIVHYGQNELYEIVMRRNKSIKIIYATGNHLWFVDKNIDFKHTELVETKNLNINHYFKENFKFVSQKIQNISKSAIKHGIIFGDGTYDKRTNCTKIHLWDDSRELEKYFQDEHKVNYVGKDSDRMIVIDYLQWNWKELPPLTANKEYLYGFLQGWFAADGNVSGGVTLSSANKDHLIWAKSAFSICGIFTSDIQIERETSPFDNSYKPLYRLSIYKRYLDKNFFLKENHQNNFNNHKDVFWRVDSVKKTGIISDVWCVNEPETQSFTLENGVVTHNCSFAVIDRLDAFVDLFHLLMVGTGVGFRILPSDVEKLPKFKTNIKLTHKDYDKKYPHDTRDFTLVNSSNNKAIITIGDSKEGWVSALASYLNIMSIDSETDDYIEIELVYDYVRPAGEILKTFGGRASGHDALRQMFDNIHKIIISSKGKLRTIDCLDVCNIIGYNVVVGGVRRTSEIALFDKNDNDVLNAKVGLFDPNHPNYNKLWRMMSNNSIFFNDRPTKHALKELFLRTKENGEPGFVNAESARKRRPNFQGINPCSEILLDDKGMCNLSEVNLNAFVIDNRLDLTGLQKAFRFAVELGIRNTNITLDLYEWDKIQKRDRLTGVSITGYCDAMDKLGNAYRDGFLLEEMNKWANLFADKYSFEMRIPRPLLVTAIKPSGTLSQLPTVSSGVHRGFAPYYIRRVRISKHDPLAKVAIDLGYPVLPEVGFDDLNSADTWVIEFPVKTDTNKRASDESAIEQLSRYFRFQRFYTDHNTSITVYVGDDEWDDVIDYLYNNWDTYVAVSFLPKNNTFYKLMPYEEIDEIEYTFRRERIEKYDIYELLNFYEKQETTEDILDDSCLTGVCPPR